MTRVVVDELGRIAIPRDVLQGAHLEPGEELDVLLLEDGIVLRRWSGDDDEDPAWLYSDEFKRGLDEALAQVAEGRVTFHASNEEFLAALESRGLD
jgi:AbrB family looped-hinge helix DNA binding protein